MIILFNPRAEKAEKNQKERQSSKITWVWGINYGFSATGRSDVWGNDWVYQKND